MDPSIAIQILAIIVLLFLSGFFSSTETALISVSSIRVHVLVEEGNKRAVKLEQILNDKSKMLTTILIGNNVVNLSLSALVTSFTINIFGNAYVGAATGLLTLFILIFGEISPKTMATLRAEQVSLAVCGVVYWLMKILTPVIFVVDALSKKCLRLVGIKTDQTHVAMTESELRAILDVSNEDGVLENEERRMIDNVVDFGDVRAKDIMIPRIDMVTANVSSSYEELMAIFRESMFTRIPIFSGSPDNIIGILNVKDLIFLSGSEGFNIRQYLREAYFTYEFKMTAELFVEMRQRSVSMAIVLNEYGTPEGLITMEDLLEEIVGDIRDEYDADEARSIQPIGVSSYRVSGSLRLFDLNDELDLNLSSEDYDSVGGLIIGELDHLPRAGETVMVDGILFIVEAVDKNRIEWVKMYLPSEESAL